MVNLFRVRTIFTGVAGTPWYANLYFSEAGGTVAQAQAAAGTFWNECRDGIGAGVTITTLGEVATIEPTTGMIVATSSLPDDVITSSGTGEVLPPATQGLLRLTTDAYVMGRRLRGRVFVPRPTEASSQAGLPTQEYRTNIEAAWTTLTQSAGASPVIWSKTHGTFFPVAGASMWTEFAVMRSRRD